MRRSFRPNTKKAPGLFDRALFPLSSLLDDPCLLEGGVGTVLLDGAHAGGRDVDEDGGAELRDENAALGEVRAAAYLPGWVELGSTRAVRIPPANLRALSGYFASSCHSPRMLA